MRIVDVCAFYSPRGGGVRTYIEQKLALAPALGVDVTVLAPGDENRVITRSPAARIELLRAPRLPVDRKYGYFADEAALHAALDRWAPDLVEVSSPWRSPVMVAEWRPAVPKALVMHADPLAAYAYRWLGPVMTRERIDRRFDGYWRHLRRLGCSFDLVVCANADLARRLDAGGVGKVRTIPMGVESGVFSPLRRSAAVRAELLRRCGLGEDALLLVAAGRLAPEKRLPMLVEAATAAGRRQPIGLVIVGEGRDRPAIMRAIGGNPHVRLLRPERDRGRFATLLASADALLHGCEAETFCMVAAEARASGIPVIVPDGGGAAEFAAGGHGLTYHAASGADAARAIIELPDDGRASADVRDVRTMADHFTDLFASYRALIAAHRAQAA
jgi:alpha-1,6-mannosyltransferase